MESGDIPSNGDRCQGPIALLGRKALVTREPPGAITSVSEAVLGFRGLASRPLLTATPWSRGLRDPAGPSRWRALLAGSHPAGLGVAGGSSLGGGSSPLPALCCLQGAPGGGGAVCLLLSAAVGLCPTSCKPEKRSLLPCPVWVSGTLYVGHLMAKPQFPPRRDWSSEFGSQGGLSSG